jgi:phage gp36-like protein
MAAYADTGDLKARYDLRTVLDLATDSGHAPLEAELSSNTIVSAALDGASGVVDAALLVGKMYTTDQLEALTGNSLALLKDIVCDIAMVRLYKRRPGQSMDVVAQMTEQAEIVLEKLRKGSNVFDLEAIKAAGLPTVNGPSLATYNTLNLLPDRANGTFPSRASRLPLGRGQ